MKNYLNYLNTERFKYNENFLIQLLRAVNKGESLNHVMGKKRKDFESLQEEQMEQVLGSIGDDEAKQNVESMASRDKETRKGKTYSRSRNAPGARRNISRTGSLPRIDLG